MLKTIILDLGNVIVPLNFPAAYDAMSSRCGVPAAELQKRFATTGLFHAFESGSIEPEEFFRQSMELIGGEMTFAEFSEIWCLIFLPQTFIPESMLLSLRERYRLVLLSNTNAIHIPFLRAQYPLLRHFHAQVLSHEVRQMKPGAAMYLTALSHADGTPEECFFTDDIAAYVEGARAHGIQAEQFLGLEKLEKDLRARGVEW